MDSIEWQQSPTGTEPWNMGMAGLWGRWEKEGKTVESYSIIVTEPNELMKTIRTRMPVIVPPEKCNLWLNPNVADMSEVSALLKPYPTEGMTAYRVSTRVNNSRINEASLIAPID